MVRHRCNILCIGNQSVVFFVDLVELKVLLISLNAPISGGIVNNDSFVVRVVLHKDGI